MDFLRRRLPGGLLNGFIVVTGVELLWIVTRRPFSAATGWLDFLWLGLAAVNVLLALMRRDQETEAWGAMVVAGGGFTALLLVDAHYAWPWGHRDYLGTMGPQLGPLPLAMPLLAWSVVASLHYSFCLWLRHRPPLTLGCLTAATTTLFFWFIDPVATYHRAWWQWHGGTPTSNYVTWASASLVLSLLAPWARAPFSITDQRPMWVVGGLGLTFIAERIAFGM
jgi:hypothetical protein